MITNTVENTSKVNESNNSVTLNNELINKFDSFINEVNDEEHQLTTVDKEPLPHPITITPLVYTPSRDKEYLYLDTYTIAKTNLTVGDIICVRWKTRSASGCPIQFSCKVASISPSSIEVDYYTPNDNSNLHAFKSFKVNDNIFFYYEARVAVTSVAKERSKRVWNDDSGDNNKKLRIKN